MRELLFYGGGVFLHEITHGEVGESAAAKKRLNKGGKLFRGGNPPAVEKRFELREANDVHDGNAVPPEYVFVRVRIKVKIRKR